MLKDLITNKIFISAIVSHLTAQIIKVIINAIKVGNLDFSRITGTGGMPSGHTASFTALATACALSFGFGSPYFAISAMLAILVIYDSITLRREAGKHAAALNKIQKDGSSINGGKELKTLLGHTIPEVIGGLAVGISVPLLILKVIWPL